MWKHFFGPCITSPKDCSFLPGGINELFIEKKTATEVLKTVFSGNLSIGKKAQKLCTFEKQMFTKDPIAYPYFQSLMFISTVKENKEGTISNHINVIDLGERLEKIDGEPETIQKLIKQAKLVGTFDTGIESPDKYVRSLCFKKYGIQINYREHGTQKYKLIDIKLPQ